MSELLITGLQWLRQLDTRVIVWAVIGGVLIQQVQIADVRGQTTALAAEVDTLRAVTEAQLILQCLDSTLTSNLRKARIPCAGLFRRYGIVP
jgi:hypothetical protein